MNLTGEDLKTIREKMDLTDAQVEQLKESKENFPETAKAVETFGETLRKMGVSEEHQIKIARAIGPVLETAAKEASDKAWAVLDRHLEKLGEIASTHEEAMKNLTGKADEVRDLASQMAKAAASAQLMEGMCPSIDGSTDTDPLDLAAQAEKMRDEAQDD